MSDKKTRKYSSVESSKKFELEPIMKFKEMPLNSALKILRESDIIVSEEEASEILLFIHTLVKITIKEFLSSND